MQSSPSLALSAVVILGLWMSTVGCGTRKAHQSAAPANLPLTTIRGPERDEMTRPTPAVGQSDQLPSDRDLRELIETDREFSRTSASQGAAEAFYRFCAEEATLLPQGEPPAAGRDSIRAALEELSGLTMTWEPGNAVIAGSRDIGCTWGFYQVAAQELDGSKYVRHGKYVSIWRKEASGDWRVILAIANQTPPPE